MGRFSVTSEGVTRALRMTRAFPPSNDVAGLVAEPPPDLQPRHWRRVGVRPAGARVGGARPVAAPEVRSLAPSLETQLLRAAFFCRRAASSGARLLKELSQVRLDGPPRGQGVHGGAGLDPGQVEERFVPSDYPASTHSSTIRSKKHRNTGRPNRSRVRVRLEWHGRGERTAERHTRLQTPPRESHRDRRKSAEQVPFRGGASQGQIGGRRQGRPHPWADDPAILQQQRVQRHGRHRKRATGFPVQTCR